MGGSKRREVMRGAAVWKRRVQRKEVGWNAKRKNDQKESEAEVPG